MYMYWYIVNLNRYVDMMNIILKLYICRLNKEEIFYLFVVILFWLWLGILCLCFLDRVGLKLLIIFFNLNLRKMSEFECKFDKIKE